MQDKVDEDHRHLREGQKGRVPDVISPVVRCEMISRGAADRSFDGVQGADVAGVQTLLEVGDSRVFSEVMTGHVGEPFFVGKPHHFRGLRATGRDGHVDEDVFAMGRADLEVIVVARVGRGDDNAVYSGFAGQVFNTGRPSGAGDPGNLLSAFGDDVEYGYQNQVRILVDGPQVVSE